MRQSDERKLSISDFFKLFWIRYVDRDIVLCEMN